MVPGYQACLWNVVHMFQQQRDGETGATQAAEEEVSI